MKINYLSNGKKCISEILSNLGMNINTSGAYNPQNGWKKAPWASPQVFLTHMSWVILSLCPQLLHIPSESWQKLVAILYHYLDSFLIFHKIIPRTFFPSTIIVIFSHLDFYLWLLCSKLRL